MTVGLILFYSIFWKHCFQFFQTLEDEVPQKPTVAVRSVARALRIVEYLANSQNTAGVREISKHLGYGAGTTQKVLNTLHQHGFVEQDLLTQRYRAGFKLLEIGVARLNQIDVRRIGRPHLEQLTRETGETVFLGLRNGREVVYIDKVEPSQHIRLDAELGSRRPFNATAIGKAHLAYLPDDELARLHAAGAFVRSTPRSITGLAALRREVAKVRKLGYAVDNEEFAIGIRCVAAPIFDHAGRVVAAVTVSGPSNRVLLDVIPVHAEHVRACTARISAALGFPGKAEAVHVA